MTLYNFSLLINNALANQAEICQIINSNSSLLVKCTDKSGFFINLLESKQVFIHNDPIEENTHTYKTTHSKEDFAKDVFDMATYHPGFFLYFIVFQKLKELGIIDQGLFYHLTDSIIHYENELDGFTIDLINRLKMNKNDTK